MAYTIKNSDGTVLLTLADGTVDQLATSLALIGKNVNAYGQYYNDNLVKLLENFATDGIQPRSPLVGQLWYNRVDGKLYVYTLDNVFKSVSSAQLYPTTPTLANAGDLWINTTNHTLYFTEDGRNWILVGPQASATTSTTNVWVNDVITDSSNNTNTVASLYNNGVLIAMATTASFTFASTFQGMTSVSPGINLNPSVPGLKFVGDATNADAVTTITNFLTANYLQINATATQYTTQRLNILNNAGLYVGTNSSVSIVSSSTANYLNSNESNKLFDIRANSSLTPGYFTAIRLNGNDTAFGKPSLTFFPNASTGTSIVNVHSDLTMTGTLSVTGPVSINGNVIIAGTTATLQTNNLQITDKNIQLAYSTSPSDAVADSGGITLMGTRNHNLNWSNSLSSWQVNDNFNLVNNYNSYQISGIPVLTSSTLGSSITSAIGINQLGTLNYLTVTNVSITTGTISMVAPGIGTSVDMNLKPAGGGVVNVNSSKITNVNTCTNPTDAANKQYVDNKLYLVGTKGFIFSVDITNMVNPTTTIASWLMVLAPPVNADPTYDLVNGTIMRVLCSASTVGIPQLNTNVTENYAFVDAGGVQNSQQVVTNVGVVTQPTNAVYTTAYTAMLFEVVSGVWTYQGPIALP
jgi:hypothetical protein